MNERMSLEIKILNIQNKRTVFFFRSKTQLKKSVSGRDLFAYNDSTYLIVSVLSVQFTLFSLNLINCEPQIVENFRNNRNLFSFYFILLNSNLIFTCIFRLFFFLIFIFVYLYLFDEVFGYLVNFKITHILNLFPILVTVRQFISFSFIANVFLNIRIRGK